MLAKIERSHNDFQALANYLIHGKERPTNPNRVAWVFGHNLATDDPLLAATYMNAIAELSKRCRNACYHTSINWHPDERPTPEIMQEIARRTLEMAGLSEHQALVMGHGDKPHAHLHMMINRVHPVTGRAWSTSHDYLRFDRIMKELSAEYGFQYVPGHAFAPALTDALPKKPNSKATYAAKRGADTKRPQWSRKRSRAYGQEISHRFDQATSWDDLEFLFAEEGLTLERKGKGQKSGLIVGDGQAYTKFSALKLKRSAKGLAKSFGGAYRKSRSSSAIRHLFVPSAPSRSIWTVDAIDMARALGSKDALKTAVQDAVRQRKARIAKKTLMEQLRADLKETFKASTVLKSMRRKKPKANALSPRQKRPHSRNPSR